MGLVRKRSNFVLITAPEFPSVPGEDMFDTGNDISQVEEKEK